MSYIFNTRKSGFMSEKIKIEGGGEGVVKEPVHFLSGINKGR